jgi:hypothetical protein
VQVVLLSLSARAALRTTSLGQGVVFVPNTIIMSNVAGNLRQRYPKCKMASKVFNSPHLKMALYEYNRSTTSKVMYSARGIFGVPNEMGNIMTLTCSILLPPKP